ncbi:Glycosyltransferase family 2 protein OS=Streptomyces alboniger OX=132473 GN=CP975_06960 PE=4 SV=1 [Streptomyces alboniger]
MSVVTAVHSNVEELDGLLDALRRQQPLGTLTEVIIVDNHRRPQLPEDFGDETIPACTVRVVHESTLGLSRARNAGVRAATGTYVLITDPDSRPRERWVHELVTAMSESGAFCVGGRTVADFRESGRTHADVSAQVLGQFVPLSWPARRTTLHEPYWLIGCNLGFRRRPEALFHEALGVTGKRHLSCEDLEFVIRAQIAGEHVVVVPEAVVDRAVHVSDLRTRQVLQRAYWHGVSMARVRRLHGTSHFYDSYRVRDALKQFARHLASRADGARVVPAIDLVRVAGFRLEQLRLAVSPARLRSNVA